MQPHRSAPIRRCAPALILALAATIEVTLAEAPPGKDPAALFDPIQSVLHSPRCMNCHTGADYPRQGEDNHRHTQNVQRGPADRGLPAMLCLSCHQAANQSRVPGAPNWHLAPVSMGWAGLTDAQLCRQLQDPARNGGRHTADEVIGHMRSDPLVQWAWTPGADRKTPPLDYPAFLQALEQWAAQGMPCPAAEASH
jgi:hypothetical protein